MGNKFRFKAPDGDFYLLTIQNGSRFDTCIPVGVSVSRYAEGDEALSDSVELDINSVSQSVFVKMLDPMLAAAKMMDYAAIVGDGYDGENLIRDAVDECLLESFEDSQKETFFKTQEKTMNFTKREIEKCKN